MSLKTIIILSPHPDDECLSVAGTILKKKIRRIQSRKCYHNNSEIH